jgi:hypothetical protein
MNKVFVLIVAILSNLCFNCANIQTTSSGLLTNTTWIIKEDFQDLCFYSIQVMM